MDLSPTSCWQDWKRKKKTHTTISLLRFPPSRAASNRAASRNSIILDSSRARWATLSAIAAFEGRPPRSRRAKLRGNIGYILASKEGLCVHLVHRGWLVMWQCIFIIIWDNVPCCLNLEYQLSSVKYFMTNLVLFLCVCFTRIFMVCSVFHVIHRKHDV